MSSPQFLALFDLDHTLLPLDSDYHWADFLARTGRAGDPVIAQQRNQELMDRYDAGTLTAEDSYAFMIGLIANQPLETLLAWQQAYVDEVILPAMTPQAIALVKKHQEQGHLCALVTATNEFVTTPMAKLFGFEHLIATIPEMKDGLYTGRTEGVPSYQAGKITRVDQWLHELGLKREQFERIWFYSDSSNDLPLMEVVSDPIATNPSPSLRQTALERGWKIIDLFDN